MDHHPRCATCLFCLELNEETVRCTNADLAQEGAWEQIYLVQGFLEFPRPQQEEQACFWFVPSRR
ncbi:hypothetical protein AAU61_08410 [Desulfocarbo indianensis]|nr:hypothetical protein AAU61_08410 [Desulfocarbo indianensis]